MSRSFKYKFFSIVLKIFPMKLRIILIYFHKFGAFPKLTNPVTFNEKVQVRKLKDRSSLHGRMVDKVESKRLVSELMGDKVAFPKTLWSSTSAEDILTLDFTSLPSDYVIKANHTSQTLIIVRNGEHPDPKSLVPVLQSWLKEDQFSSLGEWAYSQVRPTIFIEEFLNFNNRVPDDYKFFVYHGKVHFIQFDTGRFDDHRRNMYDRNWNELGFEYSHPTTNKPVSRPEFLTKLIETAEALGNITDFVRLDLYYHEGNVYFSEFTLYPGAGYEKFPSKEFDRLFGLPWRTYDN